MPLFLSINLVTGKSLNSEKESLLSPTKNFVLYTLKNFVLYTLVSGKSLNNKGRIVLQDMKTLYKAIVIKNQHKNNQFDQ